MKKIYITLIAAVIAVCCNAQENTSSMKRVEFGLDYTGELQTDFRGGSNFLNLLRLDGKVNITDRLSFNVSTLSIGSSKDNMMSDLQVFSNIEVFEEIPLTLAVAGVEWQIPSGNGDHTLFAGIRNTGEDYFASDVTSFFVNSSCGIFPTISANFPISTYPYAAMSLHYAYDSEHWGAKATVYNGEGYCKFSGAENLFRVCPKSDKVFCMVQGEYKNDGNSYFLGGSLHDGTPTMWTYGEQKVYGAPSCDIRVIAAYSHCFDKESFCRNFAGVGMKLDIGNTAIGLFTDYADFNEWHEYATELSVQVPVCKYAYVKPSLHYINGSTEKGFVGTFRIGVNL